MSTVLTLRVGHGSLLDVIAHPTAIIKRLQTPLMPENCGLFANARTRLVWANNTAGNLPRRQGCSTHAARKRCNTSAQAPALPGLLRTGAIMKREGAASSRTQVMLVSCSHQPLPRMMAPVRSISRLLRTHSISYLDDVQRPRPGPVRPLSARIDPAEPADRLPLQARLSRDHQPGRRAGQGRNQHSR